MAHAGVTEVNDLHFVALLGKDHFLFLRIRGGTWLIETGIAYAPICDALACALDVRCLGHQGTLASFLIKTRTNIEVQALFAFAPTAWASTVVFSGTTIGYSKV